PGAGRDAASAAHLERDAGRRGEAARPRADGTDGEAARDRQRRALPRERRGVVRERGDVRRRRRPDGRLRHSRVAAGYDLRIVNVPRLKTPFWVTHV